MKSVSMFCLTCKHTIAVPLCLSPEASACIAAAFGRLHNECMAGDGVCPVNDPGCDAPRFDEGDLPHCHNACEGPPVSCVDLIAYDAGVDFDIGESFDSAAEVKQFARIVAEVARAEARL